MPVDPDLVPLVGSWVLLSMGITLSDNGEHIELYGPNPSGRMVISPGGRLMGIMTKSNRQPPTHDAERATLFNEMLAYTGLIRSDGPGRFITTVDLAWNPGWGGEQLRFFTIDGDRLTIRTAEQTSPRFGERLWISELVFEREHPST
jgi:hypothetical protein